jgi:hypothetical protein
MEDLARKTGPSEAPRASFEESVGIRVQEDQKREIGRIEVHHLTGHDPSIAWESWYPPVTSTFGLPDKMLVYSLFWGLVLRSPP